MMGSLVLEQALCEGAQRSCLEPAQPRCGEGTRQASLHSAALLRLPNSSISSLFSVSINKMLAIISGYFCPLIAAVSLGK